MGFLIVLVDKPPLVAIYVFFVDAMWMSCVVGFTHRPELVATCFFLCVFDAMCWVVLLF